MTTGGRKGVIFDLDGVLIDTGQFHRQSWYDLAGEEDFQMSDELFYSTFGMQNYQIIPLLVRRDLTVEDIERMSEWKESRYRELISGKLTLQEGARGLIDELKSNGFLLAIGTSAPQANLVFMLEHTGVDDCFDAYVTGEEVSNSKPAPDTFLKAAEKLLLAPGRCLVVEDAVQGVQAAKKAGMKVVAVCTTRGREDLEEADLIVESLGELKADDFLKLLNS